MTEIKKLAIESGEVIGSALLEIEKRLANVSVLTRNEIISLEVERRKLIESVVAHMLQSIIVGTTFVDPYICLLSRYFNYVSSSTITVKVDVDSTNERVDCFILEARMVLSKLGPLLSVRLHALKDNTLLYTRETVIENDLDLLRNAIMFLSVQAINFFHGKKEISLSKDASAFQSVH